MLCRLIYFKLFWEGVTSQLLLFTCEGTYSNTGAVGAIVILCVGYSWMKPLFLREADHKTANRRLTSQWDFIRLSLCYMQKFCYLWNITENLMLQSLFANEREHEASTSRRRRQVRLQGTSLQRWVLLLHVALKTAVIPSLVPFMRWRNRPILHVCISSCQSLYLYCNCSLERSWIEAAACRIPRARQPFFSFRLLCNSIISLGVSILQVFPPKFIVIPLTNMTVALFVQALCLNKWHFVRSLKCKRSKLCSFNMIFNVKPSALSVAAVWSTSFVRTMF